MPLKKNPDSHLAAASMAACQVRPKRSLNLASIFLLAVFAAVAILVFVCTGAEAQTKAQPSQAVAAPKGNVQNGKKLFTSYGCYECHGRAAHGGVGPQIGPDPIPFSAFLAYVRHPTGNMPPYTAKVASDQDIADIHAFVASLPRSPKAKDIPLLKQ
jgi:mono/diheme cytochrome c family protein